MEWETKCEVLERPIGYLHLISRRYVDQRQAYTQRSDRIRDEHHDSAHHVAHDHFPVGRLGLSTP